MKFTFSIGGFMGPSFSLEVEGQTLFCKEFDHHYGFKNNECAIDVRDNIHWNELLTYLRSRKWKSEYIDHSALDGTGWELNLQFDNIVLSSSGSNAYPPGFRKFLKLLNAVVEGHGIHVS